MIQIVIENIKEFYDSTVFFLILFTGVFMLMGDYKYFKKVNYKKDAAVTMVIGVLYIILPFILFTISKL